MLHSLALTGKTNGTLVVRSVPAEGVGRFENVNERPGGGIVPCSRAATSHLLRQQDFQVRKKMDVGFSLEMSADIYGKSKILNVLSKDLEGFFRDKNFGDGIKSLTIGVVCVLPEMEFFFKVRSNYYKAARVFEYDVKLPYEVVRTADDAGVVAATRAAIFRSVTIIEKQEITGFDLTAFVDTLHAFFDSRCSQE